MLISYNWLNEMVQTGLGAYELSDKLTLIGLEIDGIHEQDDDVIFDIEVTSNRGDCLSHLGVARELSACFDKPVELAPAVDDSPAETQRVVIEDPDLCYRFTSRIIRGVKVGPSPDWLIKKLGAVGERSINNIADITNLVMHEVGQPMHAFDLDKLAEERIVVRRAFEGESIKTLDEEDRKLNPSILTICDAVKPVAVAGVMGGFDSGVTDSTKDVLLEVACFDRDSIRKTSASLNLSTEASYRFERGVDIENVIRASNRAAKLIAELADGTLDEFTDAYPTHEQPVTVAAENIDDTFRRLTGIRLSLQEIDKSLAGLGITNNGSGAYSVPSWRHDISIPEDLVEEAARVYGYDKIGEELPPSTGAGEYHADELRKRRLRNALASAGFDEAMSYSFVDAGRTEAYSSIEELRGNTESRVTIRDPIIEGADLMRPTLLTGILEAIHTNFNHKALSLRLFEIGRIFHGASGADLPIEREALAIAVTGRESFEGTAVPGREPDFFDLKAAVEVSADSLGIAGIYFEPSARPIHLQEGQSAIIKVDGETVGSVGKLGSQAAAGYKFKQPVFVAEIDLTSLLNKPEAAAVYRPLDIFPSVTRDVSMVVSNDVSLSEITKIVRGGGFSNFESIEYVDTYSGEGMDAGERSITVRLEYRSAERTLTDEEVDTAHAKVLSTLASELSARFR